MLCFFPVIRRYSSKLSRTCTVLPRLVMNTGPSCAAFCARLAFCWNSRLDRVVTVMTQSSSTRNVCTLEHNARTSSPQESAPRT